MKPPSSSSQGTSATDTSAEERTERSRLERLREELRSHPFAYIVLGSFVLAGPVVVHFLFPGAPLIVELVGGVAMGVVAALCAVPGQFV